MAFPPAGMFPQQPLTRRGDKPRVLSAFSRVNTDQWLASSIGAQTILGPSARRLREVIPLAVAAVPYRGVATYHIGCPFLPRSADNLFGI